MPHDPLHMSQKQSGGEERGGPLKPRGPSQQARFTIKEPQALRGMFSSNKLSHTHTLS